MRHLSLLLAGILSLSPLPALAQEGYVPPPKLEEAAVPGVMAKAVDEVIRPGYHRLHAAASALSGAMNGLCAAPSADTLATAKAAFADTVSAWSEIEMVRLGPVLEKNRFERILFYPDRKGLGLKQVQAVLASGNEADTKPEAIAGKSVAVQGLGALEYVLHGTGSDGLTAEKNGFRCRFGAAIAGNIESVAAELSAAWQEKDGIASQWKTPGPDNPQFRDAREAAKALLGILVHATETLRDQRLESFYKGKDQPAKPKSALFWRSGLTFASMQGNLRGMQALFNTAGMEQFLDPDIRSVAGSANFVLKSLLRVVSTVDADVAKAVSAPEEQAKLDFLLLNSRDLLLRFNDNFGGAIGLTAGFSFSDGD